MAAIGQEHSLNAVSVDSSSELSTPSLGGDDIGEVVPIPQRGGARVRKKSSLSDEEATELAIEAFFNAVIRK